MKSKTELRHCSNCNQMKNHEIKADGQEICLKCGNITKEGK